MTSQTDGPTQDVTQQTVQNWLVRLIADQLLLPPAMVPVDRYIDELDIDSVDALLITGELERWLGKELDPVAIRNHPTISELSGWLARTYQTDQALRLASS
jgi:acyl carrier protein